MEHLASHPDHCVLQIDGNSAFQLVSRRTFLLFQHEHRLPTYSWSRRCYGKVTKVYLRMEDGSIRAFFRRGGTAQGDPLSSGNQCMGLQEALEWAQLQFPDAMAERQLWYMDDGTLVGILADIAFFLDLLTGGVRDAQGRTFEECTGYQINIGKSSLWGRC